MGGSKGLHQAMMVASNPTTNLQASGAVRPVTKNHTVTTRGTTILRWGNRHLSPCHPMPHHLRHSMSHHQRLIPATQSESMSIRARTTVLRPPALGHTGTASDRMSKMWMISCGELPLESASTVSVSGVTETVTTIVTENTESVTATGIGTETMTETVIGTAIVADRLFVSLGVFFFCECWVSAHHESHLWFGF